MEPFVLAGRVKRRDDSGLQIQLSGKLKEACPKNGKRETAKGNVSVPTGSRPIMFPLKGWKEIQNRNGLLDQIHRRNMKKMMMMMMMLI